LAENLELCKRSVRFGWNISPFHHAAFLVGGTNAKKNRAALDVAARGRPKILQYPEPACGLAVAAP
jgi:hypothetical protein